PARFCTRGSVASCSARAIRRPAPVAASSTSSRRRGSTIRRRWSRACSPKRAGRCCPRSSRAAARTWADKQMDTQEFERRLRALALREGMTFSTFATLRRSDRTVLLTTIVRCFDPEAVYRERDVNEILKQWLASAGAMVETDHVNMRRWLVDTNVLVRTPDCAEYRLHPGIAQRDDIEPAPDVAAIDAGAVVLAARQSARETRARRKAEWLAQ